MSARPTPAQAVAAGALVLAVTSRGELAVLGLLLLVPDLVGDGGRARAVAAAGAVLASSWRWGTTSLEALAGAQAVLGPAGGVGPPSAAVGSWLAAGAIVLALGRGREPIRLVAAGATAAAILAGPAPGGDVPVRLAAGLAAVVIAAGVAWLRAGRPRLDRAIGLVAAASGAGAVVGVALSGPGSLPSLPLGLVGEGLAIAGAVLAVVLVAGSPTVRIPRPALRAGARPR